LRAHLLAGLAVVAVSSRASPRITLVNPEGWDADPQLRRCSPVSREIRC
jgi:hypothetical protein